MDQKFERWEDPPDEWWWLKPIPWRIVGTVVGVVLLLGIGGGVIVLLPGKAGPATLSMITALIGTAGVIFGALRYNRDTSQATISKQQAALDDHQRLNHELQNRLSEIESK